MDLSLALKEAQADSALLDQQYMCRTQLCCTRTVLDVDGDGVGDVDDAAS